MSRDEDIPNNEFPRSLNTESEWNSRVSNT